MTEIQNLQAMGAQRMTSLEIAQVTGKMHKDVDAQGCVESHPKHGASMGKDH